ncbi:MAG TPA: pyruvate kinase [Phycisphaerales bacterium]|nr:pyruvate kinase [Phycisphaerales bacterium]
MNRRSADTPAPAAAPAAPRPTLTKIVATVGPASDSPELIGKLIQAGVSVFRLNFSHGSLEDHARRLRIIRDVSKSLAQPVGVLGDLQGPKIRVGKLDTEPVVLQPGRDVVFVCAPADQARWARPGETDALPSDYALLAREVEPGQRVLINDGAVRCLAVAREDGPDGQGDTPNVLRARVLVGGPVTSRKGINLPDSKVSAPALSDRDWECVEWSVAHGLDLLAMSFVRRAAEVRDLKRALASVCAAHEPHAQDESDSSRGSFIPVIAKIEKPEALAELDAIIEAADGVMVARGDLGVEMDLAQVPVIQKRLIAKCDEWGKPCIVATQMLETMVQNATPTRAEVSDIAQAVIDGADAVMLSAETATGRHPPLVVETMRRAIAAAEAFAAEHQTAPTPSSRLMASRYRTAALAHGAWHVAHDIGARLVACWSQEGGTARYLSQTGLRVPIVAYSNDLRQLRRMSLLRGVTARLMPVPTSGKLADWNLAVEKDLLALGWVRAGDPIVLLAGKPLGKKGATNTLAVHYIGNPALGFLGDC